MNSETDKTNEEINSNDVKKENNKESDNDELKVNLKQGSTWKRGLYMLLFILFFSIAETIVFAVILLQFLFKLIANRLNQSLLVFTKSLAVYLFQIIRYLAFNVDKRPYPFSPWPNYNSDHQEKAQNVTKQEK